MNDKIVYMEDFASDFNFADSSKSKEQFQNPKNIEYYLEMERKRRNSIIKNSNDEDDEEYQNVISGIQSKQSTMIDTQTLCSYETSCSAGNPIKTLYFILLQLRHNSLTKAFASGVTDHYSQENRSESLFGLSKSNVKNSRFSPSLPSILSSLQLDIEAIILLHHGMAKVRGIFDAFDSLFQRLLTLLGQEQAGWRAKVMKSITSIIELEPSLMLNQSVHHAIIGRFRDEAISVRQAAVELVGKYILIDHDMCRDDTTINQNTYLNQRVLLFDKYYLPLLERLTDKGVSVRKTIVKILKAILLQQPHHPKRILICRKLIQRGGHLKEENSIKELVKETFQQLWFLCLDDDFVQIPLHSYLDKNPRANEALDNNETFTIPRLILIAHQLMEVVYGITDQEWLVKLILSLLTDLQDGESTKKEKNAQRLGVQERCNDIVSTLMDFLLQLDEGKSSYSFLNPSLLKHNQDNLRKLKFMLMDKVNQDGELTIMEGKQENILIEGNTFNDLPDYILSEFQGNIRGEFLAILDTLFIFAQVNPLFLVKHVHTLVTYLQGGMTGYPLDDELNMTTYEFNQSICESVAKIIATIIPKINVSEEDIDVWKRDIIPNLISNIYKYGSHTIQESVNCLISVITNVTQDFMPLLKLANIFYTVLYRFKSILDVSKEDNTTQNHINRALMTLGYICRYLNKLKIRKYFSNAGMESHETTELDTADAFLLPEKLTMKNIIDSIYRLFLLYLKKDCSTQVKTVQSVCLLFHGHSSFLLDAQRYGIITKLFHSDYTPVKLQVLISLKKVLLGEEARVESGAARAAMDDNAQITLKQKVQGDQDSDSSMVGGVVQEHLSSIHLLLFDKDINIRFNSLLLLGVLHRQGLVNPLQTIPWLLSLLEDEILVIYSTSQEGKKMISVEHNSNVLTTPSSFSLPKSNALSQELRKEALKQLQLEHEKHPEFVPSRMIEGIRGAYEYQRQLVQELTDNVSNPPVDLIDVLQKGKKEIHPSNTTFGPVYTHCLRSNKGKRYTFLHALLFLFEAVDTFFQSLDAKGSSADKMYTLPSNVNCSLQENVKSDTGLIAVSANPLPSDLIETNTTSVSDIRTISHSTTPFNGIPTNSNNSEAHLSKGNAILFPGIFYNRILPNLLEDDLKSTNTAVDIDLKYLYYITKIIATLPYDCQEEPLYIIYQINRLTSIHGDTLKEQVFALLFCLGKEKGIDITFYLGQGELLSNRKLSKERNAHKKMKTRKFRSAGDTKNHLNLRLEKTKSSDSSIESNANISASSDTESSQTSNYQREEDNPYIKIFTASGISHKEFLLKLQYKSSLVTMFSLLLRLKSFLKKLYMLSNERCTDYIPSVANRATSADTPFKNMVKNQKFPTFEFPVQLLSSNHNPHNSSDLKHDLQEILQFHCERFLEYETCLKRDPVDFNFERRKVNVKRKRKNSKPSRDERNDEDSDKMETESRNDEKVKPMHPPKPRKRK